MKVLESNFKKWFIVFSAGMYFFYEYIQMTLFNAIPIQLLNSFHISAASLAKLSSCYFLMQIILLFPAGILLDRLNPKKVIVLAMSISMIGTFLFSYAHNFDLAMFARLLSGIGGAFAFLSCIKLASEWFPDKMSLATGFLVTLAVSGGFIAQTPFAYLTGHTSWRIALRVLTVFGVIILTNIIFNVKSNPTVRIKNKNTISIFQQIKLALLNSQTIVSGFYIALMNLPICILGALWGGLYLEETHHYSNVLSTFVASMIFVGVIIGSPLFGYFSERAKKQKNLPMIFGALLSLLVVSLIIFSASNNIFLLVGLFLLLGITSSAQCIGYSVIVENNRIDLAATATSIASIIIMGAAALVKILYGWILDHYTSHVINNVPVYPHAAFQSAMLILPAGFILALLAVVFMRRIPSSGL